MLFSFVILHYNSLQETIKCVNSIKETQKGTDFNIVIVDNNSPDGSGKELAQLWEHEPQIKFIHNELNLGFARGNNVGFRYAKYELKSDFIILQNADTEVLQDDFQNLIVEEYKRSGFSVLGPFVKTPHPPYTTNPGRNSIPNVSYFKKRLRMYRLHYYLTFVHLDGLFSRYHLRQISNSLKKDEIHETVYNVKLHGCFMVFSPIYISKFDGLNDKTFMFNEEDLLFLRLKRNNLISVYLPSVEIFHEEDASTNNVYKAENKKNRFIYKCKIQSTKVMIKELEELNK